MSAASKRSSQGASEESGKPRRMLDVGQDPTTLHCLMQRRRSRTIRTRSSSPGLCLNKTRPVGPCLGDHWRLFRGACHRRGTASSTDFGRHSVGPALGGETAFGGPRPSRPIGPGTPKSIRPLRARRVIRNLSRRMADRRVGSCLGSAHAARVSASTPRATQGDGFAWRALGGESALSRGPWRKVACARLAGARLHHATRPAAVRRSRALLGVIAMHIAGGCTTLSTAQSRGSYPRGGIRSDKGPVRLRSFRCHIVVPSRRRFGVAVALVARRPLGRRADTSRRLTTPHDGDPRDAFVVSACRAGTKMAGRCRRWSMVVSLRDMRGCVQRGLGAPRRALRYVHRRCLSCLLALQALEIPMGCGSPACSQMLPKLGCARGESAPRFASVPHPSEVARERHGGRAPRGRSGGRHDSSRYWAAREVFVHMLGKRADFFVGRRGT